MPGKAKRVNGNASNQHNGSGKRRRDGCTCYNRISQQGLLTHSRDSLLTVLGAGSFESKVPAWPGEGLTDFSLEPPHVGQGATHLSGSSFIGQ